MQFLWNGSTWTTGADDSPGFPIQHPTAEAGVTHRTWSGAARRYVRWQKRTWTFNWENVGTTGIETRLRNMFSLSGTVTIAWDEGTFTTVPVIGGLDVQTSGFSSYGMSAQFTEQ